MTAFLNTLIRKFVPKRLRRYAKAFVPTLVAAAVAVQDLTVSAVEVNEVKTLAVGALTSLLVAAVSNEA
jgi:hypothetical protein